MNVYPVIGVPRSGTSCVAGILHRLGVFMGDKFYPANEGNPTGYYMDLDFEEVFDSDFMPSIWEIKPKYAVKLQEVIGARTKLGVDWGFKVSKTALLVPLIIPLLPAKTDVQMIVTSRNRAASKASLERFEMTAIEAESVLNNAMAFVATCREPAKFVELLVDYDVLVSDPQTQVARIAQFVNKPVTREAVEFVDETLRHFQ